MSLNKKLALTVSKLFKLSKEGQRDKFVKEIEVSQIFQKLNQLNGFETSQLIYSFYKLKIQQNQIWDSLEKLFIAKHNYMNIHDKTMCGWSMLDYTKNKEIWDILFKFYKKEILKIMNIVILLFKNFTSLISYIMARKGYDDEVFWEQIEWIFSNTINNQDERNFSLLLYSFTKMNINQERCWKSFENYIWNNEISKFSRKNQIIMINTFAKSNQGSKELWELFENLVVKMNLIYQWDLNFIIWSFGKMNKGSLELWDTLVNHIVQRWDYQTLHDLEIQFWSLDNVFSQSEFEEKDKKQLFNKLCNLEISQKLNISQQQSGEEISEDQTNQFIQKSTYQKFSNIEEILSIGRALEKNNMTDTNFYRSIEKYLIEQLNANPQLLDQYLNKIWLFKLFFQKNNQIFEEKFQNIFIQKLEQLFDNQTKQNQVSFYVNSPQVLITDVEKLQYFLNVVNIADVSDCAQNFLDKLFELFTKISQNFLNEQPKIEIYNCLGWQIFQTTKNEQQKKQILNILSHMKLMPQVYQSPRNVILGIKLSTQNESYQFCSNLLNYCKETQQIKQIYLVRIFLAILHKNNYIVLQQNYLSFKQEIQKIFEYCCDHQKTKLNFLLKKLIQLIESPNKLSIEEINKEFESILLTKIQFQKMIEPVQQFQNQNEILDDEIQLQIKSRVKSKKDQELYGHKILQQRINDKILEAIEIEHE